MCEPTNPHTCTHSLVYKCGENKQYYTLFVYIVQTSIRTMKGCIIEIHSIWNRDEKKRIYVYTVSFTIKIQFQFLDEFFWWITSLAYANTRTTSSLYSLVANFFFGSASSTSVYVPFLFIYFPFALFHFTSSLSSLVFDSNFPSFLCNSSSVCRLFHVIFFFVLLHHLTSSRSHFLFLANATTTTASAASAPAANKKNNNNTSKEH